MIFIVTVVSFVLTYILYTVTVDQIYVTFYAGIAIALSVIAYVYLWWLNNKSYTNYGDITELESYSLSKRFQLIENLKVFQVRYSREVFHFHSAGEEHGDLHYN